MRIVGLSTDIHVLPGRLFDDFFRSQDDSSLRLALDVPGASIHRLAGPIRYLRTAMEPIRVNGLRYCLAYEHFAQTSCFVLLVLER